VEVTWSREAWPRVFPILDFGHEPDAALLSYPWPLSGVLRLTKPSLANRRGLVFLHSADHAQMQIMQIMHRGFPLEAKEAWSSWLNLTILL